MLDKINIEDIQKIYKINNIMKKNKEVKASH